MIYTDSRKSVLNKCRKKKLIFCIIGNLFSPCQINIWLRLFSRNLLFSCGEICFLLIHCLFSLLSFFITMFSCSCVVMELPSLCLVSVAICVTPSVLMMCQVHQNWLRIMQLRTDVLAPTYDFPSTELFHLPAAEADIIT